MNLDTSQRYIISNLFDHPLVVLTDISFWNNNYEELKNWCDKNNAEIKGMTVEFYNKKDLTLFVLTWS